LDNLTHTLFAVTLARTPLARAGRGTTAALIIASNAPDIDSVTLAGGMASYLKWHRGPTHGPIGIAALGVATACVVWLVSRFRDRRRDAAAQPDARRDEAAGRNASLAMLVAISMIGVLLHVLMDLPNSYGVRLLSPFDWRALRPHASAALRIRAGAAITGRRVANAAGRRAADGPAVPGRCRRHSDVLVALRLADHPRGVECLRDS
jgi:membrane-bound metal-dependent hydrolase YbcI (DUF457 family)